MRRPGDARAAAGVSRRATCSPRQPTTGRAAANYVALDPGTSPSARGGSAERRARRPARLGGEPGQWFERDPLWFKRAVFYEIHVRGFFDGNDDGFGDFRGLTEKLDYLQWLGIDCIWLLPMYPSPLRDGGYDIADFYAIHPDYGTIEDFRTLRRGGPPARHPRDRRPRHEPHLDRPPLVPGVALEPDSARSATGTSGPTTDDRYEDARIIFVDTETSNWTWDPVARPVLLAPLLLPPARPQLRQPRGPGRDARRAALLARPRPRRLPPRRRAVPLRARGHELREPARDARVPRSACAPRSTRDYPDRVLLAEANQWPADVVEYFGDGDECHMAFHFPVMPRMFMALRREDATPIVEILAQHAADPATAASGGCSCATTTS